jgi:dihydroorotate dehydrogenase
LLGYDVGYPVGVPASVLTAKASWVDFFSRYGFNVFTFKTVRREPRDELPFPNWVYLEGMDSPLPLGTDTATVVATGSKETYLSRLHSYSTANSFGVPSGAPAEGQEEIRAALALLGRGKLLIVSVMGTHEKYEGEAFVEDFVGAAIAAAEAGAPAIELNLSCPNKVDPSGKMIGPLCNDSAAVRRIVKAVRRAVDPDIPLVAKLGYLQFDALAELLPLIVDDVAGIAGINTMPVKVVHPHTGEPVFQGKDRDGKLIARREAGLSGVALRYFALDFVQSLNQLRQANGWNFDILAMGGVMDAHDVRALMAAGADSVQTATAAATNPALPQQLRYVDDEIDHPEDVAEIRAALLDESGKIRPSDEVAERLGIEAGDMGALFDTPYDLPRFVAELVILRRQKHVTPGGATAPPWRLSSEATLTRDDRARQAAAVNVVLRQDQRRRSVDKALTLQGASQRMGCDPDQVAALVEVGDLLAFETPDGPRIPSWQLTTDFPARLVEGMAAVLQTFPGSLEAASNWLETPNADLDGRTPQELLLAGEHRRVLVATEAIGAAGR